MEQPPKPKRIKIKMSGSTGIELGVVLAMIISYVHNKSILWALLHGLLGWIYVIYTAVKN
jgi:hypothetical protein